MLSEICTQITAREIIESNGIVTHFQPILSARQRSVIGAEALSRGVVGVEALSSGSGKNGVQVRGQPGLIPPSQLFRMAADEGVSLPLERLCRQTAIRTFANLERHEDLILFLNVDSSVVEHDSNGLSEILSCLKEHFLSPRNVAIEVLENAVDDAAQLAACLAEFRATGFLLVLDDVGTGYSNLDRIPLIKPDILKLDRSLITRIDRDYHSQQTFKSLVQLARRIGALVVAEGIETQQQALLALEHGADLLQGYFLGVPQAQGTLECAESAACIEALARRYRQHMVERINQKKLQHRRFTILLNEILCELSKISADAFDDVMRIIISQYDNVECIYVMDEAGIQVSSTICNHRIARRGNGIVFRPAPKGADHSLKEYYYVLLDVELNKFTTDPYVSLATGNLCRTISTCFRDAQNNKMYILCIDVLCD